MKTLFSLFLTFARIGGFTFGGGLAMLPIMEKELVDKRGWATHQELLDYYAIGQCTPGIIAVNTSTFVGYKLKGLPGALFATAGMIFPSLVIITVIAAFIKNFQDIPIVNWAFNGIRAAVVALILSATINVSKKSIVDIATGIICALVTVLSIIFDISPAVYVVIAGVCGIIIKGSKKDGDFTEKSAKPKNKSTGGKTK